MKKLLTLLIITFTLSLSSQTFGNDYIFASDNFIKVDYQYHFVLGGVFGSVGYIAGLNIYEGNRSKAIWTGVAVGTGVNLVKEITDISKTGFNTNDLMWGFVGATVSSWIIDKIHYPNWKNRQLEKIKKLEEKRLSSMTDEEKLLEKYKLL